MSDLLEKIKNLENELSLKEKEIALLIKHCDTLVHQSNTLKLLNDFDSVIDENKYLYDSIESLKSEMKEFSINMEEMITVNDKEQKHLNNLIYCKTQEINALNEKLLTRQKIIDKHEITINVHEATIGQYEKIIKDHETIIKDQANIIKDHETTMINQEDEIINLNFTIYNQNKEYHMINPLYLKEREDEIESLKKAIETLKKDYEESQASNLNYCNLIEEIQTFIANAVKSQYVTLFDSSNIVENLMIIFNDKMLCTDEPKKRIRKKIDNRS